MRALHLGPGNFFRAHTAWFTAHAGDARQWQIAAFAGRSGASLAGLRDYTLVTRGPQADTRETIGVVTAASADPADWLTWWADPAVALVTATVTEAGWRSSAPDSAAGRLAAGLAARRSAGLPGVAVVPCDNVPGNGEVAREVVRAASGEDLREWVDAHVTFVSTVVDRITPKPDDPAVVVTEPFAEWVLAGTFPAGRPRWEEAGARFVDDVEPFEHRKLWLLNGAHSILAYAGSARGHATVDEAIADPVVRERVVRWWETAARHLPLATGDYRRALLERFANPRIRHTLAQIATDGSQKLPIRFGPVLRAELAAGRLPDAVIDTLAAWVAHVRGAGAPVTDVRAGDLAGRDVAGLLTLLGLDDPRVVGAVTEAVARVTGG